MTWSFPQSAVVETVGIITSTSSCTLLTVSLADTLGAWVELVASTTHEWNGLLLKGRNFNPAADAHIKVSTGAGGSETEHIIVDKIPMHQKNTFNYETFLPLRVPLGSRISAALQADNASDSVKINVQGFTGTYLGHTGFMRAVGYGVQTGGPSGGSTVTFGANDTKGAYAELTSSTAEDLVGVIIITGKDGTLSTNSESLFDLSVGAGGSERVIISNIHGTNDTSPDAIVLGWSSFYPVAIPAGTRLALRGQTQHSSDELHSMSVLGVEA